MYPDQQTKASAQELSNLLNAKQMEIGALLELTQAINNNASIEDLFRIYQFTLLALYKVSRVVVFYKDVEWEVLFKKGIKNAQIENIKVNQNWTKITEITKIENPNDLGLPQEIKWVVPVQHKDHFLAFVLIDDFKEGYTTDNPSDSFVITITNIIISAVENKRLFKRQLEQARFSKELELAEEVQAMLVPSSFPDSDALEIAAHYKPYAQIGGDYYDVFPFSQDEYLICIADVAGKNVSAALLMANFQAMLRASSEMRFDLKHLIEYLNRRIFSITQGERFITALLAVYQKNDATLQFINAGHLPMYHILDGELDELFEGCTVLGIGSELPFLHQGEITLTTNSYLVLYTDGLTDIENAQGQAFDPRPCLKHLSQLKLSAQEMLNALLNEIEVFAPVGHRPDDLAILVVRVP